MTLRITSYWQTHLLRVAARLGIADRLASGPKSAAELAHEIGAPLLARIPLEPAVSAGGDRGQPAALDPRTGAVFASLVDAVLDIAPVVEMGDCTARMLDAIEAAVASKSG